MRILPRPLGTALAAWALAVASAGAAPLAVPLALEEGAGVARSAFPATASVPLPRGRVRAAEALWLATPDGRPAPLQTHALERWPDGSVRWLLLDFLADVPAGGRATYTLRDGRPPRAAAGPAIRLTRGDRLTLDTGRLRAVVPADGQTLFAALAAGTASLGAVALPPLGADGGASGPPVPAAVRVETEGPIRTELVMTGRYPAALAYEVRIAAFAGQPFLRLQHTVTNLGDASYLPVRTLTLSLPGRFTHGAVGVDGGLRALDPLSRAHELRHDDATPARLDGTAAGRHADGWARATDGTLAATLVARWFWEEWPKALRVGPEGLSLDLLAGEGTRVRLGTGAAKTHELWIALEPVAEAREPDFLAAALRSPLVAVPPADWTVRSRALPQALSADDPDARAFLGRLASAWAAYRRRASTERWDDGAPVDCAARTEERPRTGLYGLLNWGDWQFPGYRDTSRGCDAWGNLEYDLPQVLALAFASTGERTFLDGLVPAARHFRDVDIIHHWPPRPDWVGLNHPHKVLHFAVEARENIDLGHTWAEGLVSFWRLSGETRALEAARRLADALVPRVARARNPRQFGWPMIALVAVYDATGERRYLDAARAYATAAMAAHRPTPAAGNWMMGILADGLAAVDAATSDPAVRRWLVAYADAYVAEPGSFKDARFALPLGYLGAATGDARYTSAARDVARSLKPGTWGKPLAWIGRTGFRLLAPLAGQASAPRTQERPPGKGRKSAGSDPALTPGRGAPPRGSGRARRAPSPSR